MRFRLRLLWFEIEIDTPAPEQVSSIDLVTALYSAMAQGEGFIGIPMDVDSDGDGE